MTETPPPVFSEREIIILDLPLAANTKIIHPEKVSVRVYGKIHDVGAYCYTVRSATPRKPKKSRHVVLSSFRKERNRNSWSG